MSIAPAGYHTVTPYLVVGNSVEAISFYQRAFGAELVMRLVLPGGGTGHAEVRVGDSPVMLSDANPAWGSRSPADLGGTTVGMCVYVRDVDVAFATAVAAGATALHPPTDMFYGDRTGTVQDPFGHKWTLATRQRDLSPAEMQAAMDEWMKSMPRPA